MYEITNLISQELNIVLKTFQSDFISSIDLTRVVYDCIFSEFSGKLNY